MPRLSGALPLINTRLMEEYFHSLAKNMMIIPRNCNLLIQNNLFVKIPAGSTGAVPSRSESDKETLNGAAA